MLADLRRLRELQLEQADALGRGDVERLTELDAQRLALQARIAPGRGTPSGSDLAEARALAELLRRDQDELVRRAAAARDALRREIGMLGMGRAALAGYRPPPAGRSMYLDSAR